ncbi:MULTISPECIES: hypothetical protein [Mycobacterium]|uniref:Uncharacterized protein n=1 Tax=Mycobacterium kiyosense TaxID=2871094 RepID=A0A9P3V1D2_9MYCO|nr:MULTISPECIES: hypothetical protein [Mycobacterium]BDB41051.1 hypothetical protein IWGMT90018_14970 [Mycobacterium kiyosense]BDE12847.1 hypothetical protein MKCMC460_17070 [Mycobacterium sp. 20KCMC460]GLB84276.1 hypothetical protein SRL2020028_35320 [Mycobacterium kiyosense]GLB90274.1 hypothetical protein SRL2020130_30910 [Mycobacterium kiyosense]GLB97683.1 hypothetical protein SRL2020226_44590 [Mycobacterium kiyosense]
MRKLVALGVLLVVGIELLALLMQNRTLVLAASGVGVALVLLNIRKLLGSPNDPPDDESADDSGDALRRWVASTETTIHWSESTRADWDRHLRPMLARRFELATGQRRAKDPAAYAATGEMLFGPQLWVWVNPNDIGHPGNRQHPGPGRAALEEILRRLEQV